MAWVWHRYDNADAMQASLADALAAACRRGLSERGGATLALAGGRTPLPAYRTLADQALPWAKVLVVATDERCVPHEHPACNSTALETAMADASGLDLRWLTPSDGDPERSEQHARGVLVEMPVAFDAVLLGMGGDAHTASLFPAAAQLEEAMLGELDAYRIDPQPLPPEAPFARVTLGLRRLLNSRVIHLAVTGQSKLDVLESVLACDVSLDIDRLLRPIAAVLRAPGAPVQIHWSP